MIDVRQTKYGEIVYDSLSGTYGADGKYGFKWFLWEKEAEEYLRGIYRGEM